MRQSEADFPLQDQTSHISNTGRMVEEMEIKMRNQLQEVRHIYIYYILCAPWCLHPRSFAPVEPRQFVLITAERALASQVYFGKTRDIVFDLRSIDDLEKARRQRELQKELVGFIKR